MAGQKPDPGELVAELWGKISARLEWGRIDHRLLRNGTDITLLGILHVDPTTDLVTKIDRVIKFIRDSIKRNPKIKDITVDQISENASVTATEARIILKLIGDFQNFWHSASGGNEFGYTSIGIGAPHVKTAYLSYTDLESIIEEFAELYDPDRLSRYGRRNTPVSLDWNDDEPNDVAPAVASVQMDFSFMADSRLALIVERDYAELQQLNAETSPKSVLVIAGGMIEALLFDALVVSDHWSFEEASKRYLKDMIYPAKNLGIIRHDNITDVLRIFRNIIHASREVRENLVVDASHARHALTSVQVIASEVKDWHARSAHGRINPHAQDGDAEQSKQG